MECDDCKVEMELVEAAGTLGYSINKYKCPKCGKELIDEYHIEEDLPDVGEPEDLTFEDYYDDDYNNDLFYEEEI